MGDYLRDTAHLSMLEDAAYRRLLDAYYVRERPLPANVTECCKLARTASKPERTAVAYVLKEFFTLETDGYHQSRADIEVARFRGKSVKATTSANLRWGRSNGNANAYANGHANASPTHIPSQSVGNALQSPIPNPQSPEESNPLPPFKKGATSKTRSEARAEKDEAVGVWCELIASDGARPKRSPRVQAAIDAVGGWTRIAMREQGVDSAIVRKQFCDAYRSAAA